MDLQTLQAGLTRLVATCELSGMSERNGTMVNGALIALGAVAILDNVVTHWLLGLHRAVPNGGAVTGVETGLVVVASCCW